MIFYVMLLIGLVAADQIIKFLVRYYLTENSFLEIIPNLIHLTHQENKGISFSFFADLPDLVRVPFLVGISTIVVIILSLYVYRNWRSLHKLEKWGFVLIISGALGNLIDRSFRQQVTDYMYFHYFEQGFFVNNLADDLISIGFALLIIKMIWFEGKNE